MNIPRFLPLALLACLGLIACDSDKATGTMDDTNQSAMAHIYLPDHKPAAKALVQAWRVDDSTKKAAYETITADDGSYRLGDLSDGLYRVVARKDGLVTMQDSMLTVAGRLSPRDDTLGKPAVATGFVKMTGSDKPSSVTILVMGTDIILYNVDISGSFKLEGLATGTYRLRLSTIIENYTTTAATIRVSAGKTTDVGTIRMNFTGTPPVDSLAARIDSASNDVLLSWKLPTVTDFRFVRVYREPLDGSEKPILLGYSLGSTFRDSTKHYSKTAKDWLYTVRIHTLDGDSGYPAWVKVSQQNRVEKILGLELYIHNGFGNDSGWFEVLVTSSPERPKSLVWTYGGVSHSIRVDSLSASPWGPYAYQDSFMVRFPIGDSIGRRLLRVVLTGNNGEIKKDSGWFNVPSPDTLWWMDSLPRDTTPVIDTSRTDTTWRDTVWNDSNPIPDTSRIDTTWRDTVRSDSLRFSLDAGTTPGIRTLVATVTTRDGKSYTASIRFVVIASKTKSVATMLRRTPGLAASLPTSGEATETIASLVVIANKPDPEA